VGHEKLILPDVCSVALVSGGKTQLCMQLACNVQIPKRFGGAWEGEAVYIGQSSQPVSLAKSKLATLR